jgi:hypothetical protein
MNKTNTPPFKTTQLKPLNISPKNGINNKGTIKPTHPVLGLLLKTTGTTLNNAKKLSKIENGIIKNVVAKNIFLNGKCCIVLGLRKEQKKQFVRWLKCIECFLFIKH